MKLSVRFWDHLIFVTNRDTFHIFSCNCTKSIFNYWCKTVYVSM